MSDSAVRGDGAGPTGWDSPAALPSPGADRVDRVLLAGDGTLSKLPGACTGEPVVTRTMRRAGPATLEALRFATSRSRWPRSPVWC
jgi:hypothetical protein